MSDAFPNTPVTLLALIEERGEVLYQDAWRTLFDLYHGPIRFAVLAAFRRYNWHQVPDDLVEETIADVVISFSKARFSYDPSKGRFRNYLRQLATWRVCDQIARIARERSGETDSIDGMGQSGLELIAGNPSEGSLEQKEQEACRASLLATMLEDIRQRVSPQTYLIFELTKVQGKAPDEVAAQFRVRRNVVDNAAYRVISKLKELARQPEYQREYFE